MSDERMGVPSASGIARLAACPGSWNAERGLPEESSADAESGQRVHAALAEDDVELTDTEESVAERAERLCSEVLRDFMPAPEFTEREERLKFYVGRDVVFTGKPDVLAWHSDTALIVDYKTGWQGAGLAERNLQLRALAVLARHQYGVRKAICALVQPNAKPAVTVTEYDLGDLMLAQEEVWNIIEASKAPDAPRIAGQSQCQYCRAKATCPELRAVALTMLQVQQEPAAKLATEELLLFLTRLPVVKYAVAAIEREAKRRLEENPESVPGWKLEPGSDRRKVTDAREAYKRLAAVLTPEQFNECCTVKISALETAHRKETGMKVKDAKPAFEALLDGLIERKQSAPSLERIK